MNFSDSRHQWFIFYSQFITRRRTRETGFLFNPNRSNVAASRARASVIVFGPPKLVSADGKTPEQLGWVNELCRHTELSNQHLLKDAKNVSSRFDLLTLKTPQRKILMTNNKMRIYWDSGCQGVTGDNPEPMNLEQTTLLWEKKIFGYELSFLGIVDSQDQTIQFRLESDVPEPGTQGDPDDLKIVLVDIPVPEKNGSYSALINNKQVYEIIRLVYQNGMCLEDLKKNLKLELKPW